MLAIQSSLTCVCSCDGPRGQTFCHRLARIAGQRVAQGARRREPGRQRRVGRGRRLGALQQIEVLVTASYVSRQQQVGGQAQQPVRGSGQQRSRHGAQVQWRRQRRVVQVVSHDAVLQEGQGAVGLPGREEVAGRMPGVAHRLEPLGGPQLECLFAGSVPGPQFGVQQLADQMVVAEDRPVLIERHQEQAGPVDAAQQRGRVLAPGDGGARVGGQLAQDGGVQHEPGHLGGLLIEDLGGEVLGDLVAADLQRPPGPRRICARRAATARPSAAPRPSPRFAGAAAPHHRQRSRHRSWPGSHGFPRARNAGHGRGVRTAPRPSAAGAAAAQGQCGWPAPAGRRRPASVPPGRSWSPRPRGLRSGSHRPRSPSRPAAWRHRWRSTR